MTAPIVVPHRRMSLAQVENYLYGIRVFTWGFEYAKDDHFRDYILTELASQEAFEAFLQELDRDNIDHTDPGPFRCGCIKARVARERVKESAERYKDGYPSWWTPEKVRLWALSSCRRICCSCHEVGSYARRDTLPTTHQECPHWLKFANRKLRGRSPGSSSSSRCESTSTG